MQGLKTQIHIQQQDAKNLHILNNSLIQQPCQQEFQMTSSYPTVTLPPQKAETRFVQPNASAYTHISPRGPAPEHVPMHQRSYSSNYRQSYDPNLAGVISSGSQIVPVLLHDPTMISPAPSCSSVESSSLNIQQLSPSAVNNNTNSCSSSSSQNSTMKTVCSNQPTLSTFQYPSPSHDNSKSVIARKPRFPIHNKIDIGHTFNQAIPQSASTSSGGHIDHSAGVNPTHMVRSPPHENLGIDIEKIPPPPGNDIQVVSDPVPVVDTNTVLDHRENSKKNGDSGSCSHSNSGTIRRSKKHVYTNDEQ